MRKNKKELKKKGCCDKCGKEMFMVFLNLKIVRVDGKMKGIAICNTCEKNE